MEYLINLEIFTPYAGAAGMLLHINGKCTMGKFEGSVTIVTRRVSLMEQQLLTLPEHLSSPLGFGGIYVAQCA
jgi:hypothetical protein